MNNPKILPYEKEVSKADTKRLIELLKHLRRAIAQNPHCDLAEAWDCGINLCMGKLLNMGYTFQPLRRGYEGLLIDPNGKYINTTI